MTENKRPHPRACTVSFLNSNNIKKETLQCMLCRGNNMIGKLTVCIDVVLTLYRRPAASHHQYERDGADYHLLLKELLRTALGDMSSADVKDIESCVVALRNEALKKEKEKSGKSKKGTLSYTQTHIHKIPLHRPMQREHEESKEYIIRSGICVRFRIYTRN